MDITIKTPQRTTLLTGGKYCPSDINIIIDGGENISSENIVEGITILGMTGTALTITPQQLEELSNL